MEHDHFPQLSFPSQITAAHVRVTKEEPARGVGDICSHHALRGVCTFMRWSVGEGVSVPGTRVEVREQTRMWVSSSFRVFRWPATLSCRPDWDLQGSAHVSSDPTKRG